MKKLFIVTNNTIKILKFILLFSISIGICLNYCMANNLTYLIIMIISSVYLTADLELFG